MNRLQRIQTVVRQRRTLVLSLGAVLLIVGIFLFDYLSQAIKPIEIIATQPLNNDVNTTIQGDFLTITFSKPLSGNARNKITTSIDPQVPYATTWKDNYALALTNANTKPLELQKTYTVSILNNGKLLKKVAFTTGAYYTLPANQQFNLFKEGQSAMQDEAKRIIAERPWVTRLPISKTAYVAFWDDTAETIRVQFYIKAGGLNTAQKVQNAKNEVNAALTAIGVDLTKEKVTYQELNI